MIHTSYRQRKGTDLTDLAPDPNTFPLPAERTFLQHPGHGGQRRTPQERQPAGLGSGRGARRSQQPCAPPAVSAPSTAARLSSGRSRSSSALRFRAFCHIQHFSPVH